MKHNSNRQKTLVCADFMDHPATWSVRIWVTALDPIAVILTIGVFVSVVDQVRSAE
jgi:hypothetical protein